MSSKGAVASEKWWSADDVAVVTGANKGIGFEIARQLGAQGLKVVVTSRDEGRGAEAMKKLQADESTTGSFEYCQADITDSSSIQKCADFLKQKYGKITILVNNAGIAYKGDVFGADEAQKTIDCNVKGTRAMCEAVLPMMSEGARIVNVCSMAGKLRQLKSDDLKQRFQNPKDADDIQQLADGFAQGIRDNNYEKQGYSSSMYGMSKLAEVSYTMWLARQVKSKGIMVNAVCPGYVDTDMTSHKGPKPVADGADTPVWVALLPPKDNVTGDFFQERKHFQW